MRVPSPADHCHLRPVPAPSHPRLQAAGLGGLPRHLPGLVETPASGPRDAHGPPNARSGGLGPAEAHAGQEYEEGLGLEPSSAGTCDMGPPGVLGGVAGHLSAIPPLPPLPFSRPPCPHSLGRDCGVSSAPLLSPLSLLGGGCGSAGPEALPGESFVPSIKDQSPWGGGDPDLRKEGLLVQAVRRSG